jgi:hypothetical protein
MLSQASNVRFVHVHSRFGSRQRIARAYRGRRIDRAVFATRLDADSTGAVRDRREARNVNALVHVSLSKVRVHA